MKTSVESIKHFLEYSLRVLGTSTLYRSPSGLISSEVAVKTPNESKKFLNFYSWPQPKLITFNKDFLEASGCETLFIFFSASIEFDKTLHDNSEMIIKMHQALGGDSLTFLVGWLTPNAEFDFFSVVTQCSRPLRIVFFREALAHKEKLSRSEEHLILETLSPLVDIGNQGLKRQVWNDFKLLLSATSKG